MKLNSSTFVFFVILQVVLAFTFITVFFFTYGKILEKQAIMNNIDYLIQNIIGDSINLSDDIKNSIIDNIDIIDNIKNTNNIKDIKDINNHGNTGNNNNNNNPDIIVEKNNKKIFKNSMIILSVILFLVLLLFIFFMSMRNSNIPFFQNFEFIKIFKESMIILVFVALTEFCFLYFFGSKYIVVNPNLLKKEVIDQLSEYSISTDK
jgi:hypothetical protein